MARIIFNNQKDQHSPSQTIFHLFIYNVKNNNFCKSFALKHLWNHARLRMSGQALWIKHSFYSLLDLVHRLTEHWDRRMCVCERSHSSVLHTDFTLSQREIWPGYHRDTDIALRTITVCVCVWERAIWPWLGSTAVWGCGERVSVARTKILSCTHAPCRI